MKLRTLNILYAFLLGFFSIGSEASSQLTKLNVITTGVSPTSLPSYIAKESGIFARNDLDVQVVRATSSISVMALISGELGIVEVAGPSIIRSNLRGADVVFIAAGVVTLTTGSWLPSISKRRAAQRRDHRFIGPERLVFYRHPVCIAKARSKSRKGCSDHSRRRYPRAARWSANWPLAGYRSEPTDQLFGTKRRF